MNVLGGSRMRIGDTGHAAAQADRFATHVYRFEARGRLKRHAVRVGLKALSLEIG